MIPCLKRVEARPWPDAILALLRKRLSSKPPASYSSTASEALRVCGFPLDRAQVRRWARQNGLAPATPHRWFPGVARAFPLLNLLDDCSRYHRGTTLYERELLLAYFDTPSHQTKPLVLFTNRPSSK